MFSGCLCYFNSSRTVGSTLEGGGGGGALVDHGGFLKKDKNGWNGLMFLRVGLPLFHVCIFSIVLPLLFFIFWGVYLFIWDIRFHIVHVSYENIQ